MKHLFFRSWFAAAGAIALASVLLAACDSTPGPVPLDQQPPMVSDLTVAPETIRTAELPADRIADAQALVDVATTVRARDPDGTVARVLILIDPAYGSSAPAVAQLGRSEDDQFAGTGRYAVSTDRADVLMIRAFAVDNDSLTSNQVVGKIHFLPDDANAAN